MKKFSKFLSIFLLLCTIVCCFGSCENIFQTTTDGGEEEFKYVDYAGQLKLDLTSPTLKWEVTVKSHIDGDTTHFYINQSGNINNLPANKTPGIDGVLKARYLNINTPESTGKIEPWGRAASNFTKERVLNAESIIIESNDTNWNVDSTGERFLVWVWYKPQGASDYRNLNLEILQEALAVSSAFSGAIYGDMCSKAIDQALQLQKYVYSPTGTLDPDFPYGEGQFVTIKELKANIDKYYDNESGSGSRVAFEGVIVKNSDGSVYIESYDEEDGIYYGISAYYLTSGLDGFGLKMLQVGNKLRFSGVVGKFGESYQITDLKYDVWNKEDPNNMVLISEGNIPGYPEVSYLHFDPQSNQGSVRVQTEVEGEIVTKELPFMYLAQDSSVSMKNLKVKSTYTTKKGTSKGAISIYCEVNGIEIQVRTIVLRDAKGELITEDIFAGKTIDVKGTIDYYVPEGATVGTYQIQIFSIDDITFHN